MANWKKVIVSGSDAQLNSLTASLAGDAGNVGIGSPGDSIYNDGFFDYFTPNTRLADAIDEISEAFLLLAPTKQSVLSGSVLNKTNPTTFTGYIANGLNSSHWYQGISANQQTSFLTAGTTVSLNTNGFRIGTNANITASLVGGVTASRSYGTNALASVNNRALSSGNGTTGILNISNISQYNTFWAGASGSISDTITNTGSVRYNISADNTAGSTNDYQLFYVGSITDYPTVTIPLFTASLSNITYNWLSGIQYYKTADVILTLSGSNVFKPVYNQNQVALTSTYFTTLNTGSNNPSTNDVLIMANVSRSLTANLNSGVTVPTATISISKPGKSNVTTNTNLGTGSFINSYTSAQSTNNTDSQIEYFLDEANRMTDLQTSAFASGSALTNGNLQVRNSRLIVGAFGDWVALTQGGVGAGYADYFRRSDPTSNNKQNGSITLTRNASAFAASSPISAWGSGGKLEVALILSSDITGATTSNFIYDLGRVVGNDSGNIKGIRDTVSSNTTTVYTTTWSLPSGINTGTAASTYVVLWVRYNTTAATDYLTQINLAYT